MNIFTKPITEVTYEDVISFCKQGIGEGPNLDYKRDFPPSGLEKTISAFANTSGGVILIGVEDEDSKPRYPFEGIDYKDKLEERVWNIIVDNIYPPVFPEIKVCTSGNKAKAFVVIRVPQSNETPHAIYNHTQVYVRTGNRNKPEDLATVEQIEWLTNRRKKSEDFRESLYQRAEERFRNVCEQKKAKIPFAEFTLSFSPLYPQKAFTIVDNLEDILNQMKVTSEGREFPWLPAYSSLQPIQDGMVSFFLNEQNGFITHTEINKFGLFFYKEDLGWGPSTGSPGTETRRELIISTIITILDLSFEAVAKYYNIIGFWGLLEIKISLQRLLGVHIISLRPRISTFRDEYEKINNYDNHLRWHLITSVSELNNSIVRQNKLLELGKEICWSFGFKTDEQVIKQIILKEK